MKYKYRNDGLLTGMKMTVICILEGIEAVLSHSHSESSFCHFILNLKLIVFLQPEILDYTHKMILAAFCSTLSSVT